MTAGDRWEGLEEFCEVDEARWLADEGQRDRALWVAGQLGLDEAAQLAWDAAGLRAVAGGFPERSRVGAAQLVDERYAFLTLWRLRESVRGLDLAELVDALDGAAGEVWRAGEVERRGMVAA